MNWWYARITRHTYSPSNRAIRRQCREVVGSPVGVVVAILHGVLLALEETLLSATSTKTTATRGTAVFTASPTAARTVAIQKIGGTNTILVPNPGRG